MQLPPPLASCELKNARARSAPMLVSHTASSVKLAWAIGVLVDNDAFSHARESNGS